MPHVLFLGATGYIGASVFNAFINAHPSLDCTVLVRTPSHASHIRSVNTVIGTLEDRELLTDLASRADVVVNAARADDLEMIEAVISGLKRRKEVEEKVPALIHTCGGDTFDEREIWDDTDDQCVDTLISRPVEKAISDAEQQGLLNAYFIAPTAVHGVNSYGKPSPFYLELIREFLSLPKPPIYSPSIFAFTSAALKKDPSRIMGMVHINDLTTLYLLVFDSILQAISSSPKERGRPRVYIASASERLCASVADRVHQALAERKLISSIAVNPPEKQKLGKESEPHFIARHAAAEFGWAPVNPDWEHDFKWDVDGALEKLKIKPGNDSATKS